MNHRFRRRLKKVWRHHRKLYHKHRWSIHITTALGVCALMLYGTLSIPSTHKTAAAGTLSCTVRTSSCQVGETNIFRLNGSTNAHAELASQSNYGRLVCCSGPTGLGNSCVALNSATVLRLSGSTNAHVEQNDQSTTAYDSNKACISANVGDTITVAYQNTNCTGYQTTVASISGTTNAHVGDSTAYTKKICASITAAPGDPSWTTGTDNFRIYQSSSLTWGAGTLVCAGTLTDNNASTINCGDYHVATSTQYRIEVELENEGGTLLGMGSGDYVDHKLVKNGWAGANPTLGNCDVNDFGSDDDGLAGCAVSFNGNDVRIVETDESEVYRKPFIPFFMKTAHAAQFYNFNIDAVEKQGFMYLITTDSTIPGVDSTSYFNTSIDSLTEDSSKIGINGPGTSYFTMQTGYYIGNGTDSRAITTSGVSNPGLVMLWDNQAATGSYNTVFKTSSMTGEITSQLAAATSNLTSNYIQSLTASGFTVGTDGDVNTSGARYQWAAFGNSDCSSTGTFCVGSYTGDAADLKSITVGFQPELVLIKGNTGQRGVSHTATMVDGEANYFYGAAKNSSSSFYDSSFETGFWVGPTANESGYTYYFVAFKQVPDRLKIGTYSGNSSDNRDITGLGFNADLVWTKTESSANPPALNSTESNDNESTLFVNNDSQTNYIKGFVSDGFRLGTHVSVNASSNTYHYVAFSVTSEVAASGSFTMATGSYTGNGFADRGVTGIGFEPDLVIINSDNATQAVFTTKLMPDDSTAYLASATANLTNSILSLDADGFTLGSDATVNASSNTYHWQAFGNAFDPVDFSGAADFAIGATLSITGDDDKDIYRVGFQPDLVVFKSNAATYGVFRTVSNTALYTSYFHGATETLNVIQAFNTDGFQLGTDATVNSSVAGYWFAFKNNSETFKAGTYVGTGSAHNVTGVGFQPDMVWAKLPGGTAKTVTKPSTLAGDSTQYFTATANVTDRFTGFVSDGFSVGGNQWETNLNALTYYYLAWMKPLTPFYYDTGSMYSSSVDLANYSTATNRRALRMSWTQDIPTSCTLSVKIRGDDETTYSGAAWSSTYSGGDTSICSTTKCSVDLTADPTLEQGKQYYQYYVSMGYCNSGDSSPTLFDIRIDFD